MVWLHFANAAFFDSESPTKVRLSSELKKLTHGIVVLRTYKVMKVTHEPCYRRHSDAERTDCTEPESDTISFRDLSVYPP